MPKPHRVWIDAKKKQVLVDGYVSLNEGLLEMFACPSGTKEHESVVAVYSSAQMVHAGLLAVGAKVGHPVKWDPKFEPPAGTEIDIEVRWIDASGKWQTLPAQQWLTDTQYQKTDDSPLGLCRQWFLERRKRRPRILSRRGRRTCLHFQFRLCYARHPRRKQPSQRRPIV